MGGSRSAEEWNLAIGGMHCASCVARVENALKSVPGVADARVNLATERAGVVVDPDRVSESELAAAVSAAGYRARRDELKPGEGAESLRRERAEGVAYWRTRLIVGVALTIPLIVLGYAPLLFHLDHASTAIGWTMFALAVGAPGLPGRPLHPRGLGAAEAAVGQHGHADRPRARPPPSPTAWSGSSGGTPTTPTRSWTPGSS